MNDDLQQLAREVIDLTGAAAPAMLEADAPVLRDETSSDDPYIIGVIGGKDVGKSSLINALIGKKISPPSAFGPGTEIVVAYAHRAQARAVRELLEAEAPGKFETIAHDVPQLSRQILLDLPDIDSRFADHVELTRRMLRHMLFPIWIQSIEKYADQSPQKLLAAVAEGNDPRNFVFVLNKIDQLQSREGARELGDDFAKRIARTLSLSARPHVFLISATQPEAHHLPQLRAMLAQQKATEIVRESLNLAARQRRRTLLNWIDEQKLPARAERLGRLEDEAQELAAARIGVPLVDSLLSRLMNDPAHRAAIIDDVMAKRVSRWPIVNWIHPLLSPLTALWRANALGSMAPERLIQQHLEDQGRSLSSMLQTTFALLHQTHGEVASIFGQRKLWEDLYADAAGAQLVTTLAAAMQRQREIAMQRIARHGSIFAGFLRILLTIGAVIWFPFVQPVLEIMLQTGAVMPRIALLVVQLLGVTYLLKSALFLAIWFLVLWLVLRWDTQRRVNRLLTKSAETELAQTILDWLDELLDPIRRARQRVEELVSRINAQRSAA